jgi:signal transduction histidine kinase
VLSQNDEAFLLAVSEQVAQAMERARLIEQTQKAAVELQAVADVSTATSTILNPEELLQSVVDLTKRNFGLYHAHVYLLDDVGKNLDLVVGAGEIGRSMAAEGWGISLDEENSLVASVARTRQGQVITDVRQYMGYMPNPLLPDTLSELAVPMIVGDTLLGVFDVQSDAVGRFTEDEDVGVYGTLASQVAVALQNAKLYAEQLDTVERLRELDNMKSAFLANMSHELRTPLNSILGFTQVIQEGLDGPLTDMMESDLELIEKNGKHLLNLINDVLDMAKIEAGRLTLSPEPLSLYELLDDVIVSNGLLARDRNLYLNLEADPDADWTVIADHVRMRQIFINLIGNSIKFTESGGITVEFERLLATSEFEKSRVQVRICDTGVGIPPDRLEDIFEAFSQVDSTTTRKAGGTGLGLPISRRLVELHGGKLWAESKGIPGQGSVFYLELPIGK